MTVIVAMSKELPSELRIVLDNALREAADNVAQRQVDDDRQRASRGAPRGGRGQRGRVPQRARGSRGRAGRGAYRGTPTSSRGRGPVAPNVPDITSEPTAAREHASLRGMIRQVEARGGISTRGDATRRLEQLQAMKMAEAQIQKLIEQEEEQRKQLDKEVKERERREKAIESWTPVGGQFAMKKEVVETEEQERDEAEETEEQDPDVKMTEEDWQIDKMIRDEMLQEKQLLATETREQTKARQALKRAQLLKDREERAKETKFILARFEFNQQMEKEEAQRQQLKRVQQEMKDIRKRKRTMELQQEWDEQEYQKRAKIRPTSTASATASREDVEEDEDEENPEDLDARLAREYEEEKQRQEQEQEREQEGVVKPEPGEVEGEQEDDEEQEAEGEEGKDLGFEDLEGEDDDDNEEQIEEEPPYYREPEDIIEGTTATQDPTAGNPVQGPVQQKDQRQVIAEQPEVPENATAMQSKAQEGPADQPEGEQPKEQPAEQLVDQPGEQLVDLVDQPGEQLVDQPREQLGEQPGDGEPRGVPPAEEDEDDNGNVDVQEETQQEERAADDDNGEQSERLEAAPGPSAVAGPSSTGGNFPKTPREAMANIRHAQGRQTKAYTKNEVDELEADYVVPEEGVEVEIEEDDQLAEFDFDDYVIPQCYHSLNEQQAEEFVRYAREQAELFIDIVIKKNTRLEVVETYKKFARVMRSAMQLTKGYSGMMDAKLYKVMRSVVDPTCLAIRKRHYGVTSSADESLRRARQVFDRRTELPQKDITERELLEWAPDRTNVDNKDVRGKIKKVFGHMATAYGEASLAMNTLKDLADDLDEKTLINLAAATTKPLVYMHSPLMDIVENEEQKRAEERRQRQVKIQVEPIEALIARHNLPRPVHESVEEADKDRATAILGGCMYYYLFHALFKGERLSREEVAKMFHVKSATFNKACSGKRYAGGHQKKEDVVARALAESAKKSIVARREHQKPKAMDKLEGVTVWMRQEEETGQSKEKSRKGKGKGKTSAEKPKRKPKKPKKDAGDDDAEEETAATQ